MTWECSDVIGSNQTYIDNLKDLYGVLPKLKNSKGYSDWFGNDMMFWPLPTLPNLHINYLERLYTWAEIE